MSEFDAIFVGAGHNSLACAAHLALKGWKVAVFERNAAIGGAVRTGEYTLPGFRHDFGAMNLSLFAGSAFHRKYANELKTAGLEFAPVADCFASAFPDGRWFGVSTDLEKTASRIAAFSTADAETWRRLVAAFPGEAEHLFRLLGSPMTARALAGTAWNAWRKKGVGGALDTMRLLLASPRAWLDENFESAHVKATLAAWGMHLDFAPDIAGGAVFPYLESMANQSFGMVLGKGGADTMIRALEKMLTAAGGKIFTGAEVAEIATSGRQGDRRTAGIRRDPHRDEGGDRRRRAGRACGRLLPTGFGRRRLRHGDEEVPPCAGHDDDPSGARRPAGLAAPAPSSGNSPMCIWRRRSTPWRGPISRPSPGSLPDAAGAGGRPADGGRSVARARPASTCSGCRFACCRPRLQAMRPARSRPAIGTRSRSDTPTASSA